MNKEGNIDDIVTVVPWLLLLVIIMIIGAFMHNQFYTGLVTLNSTDISNSTLETIKTYDTNIPKGFDYAFVLLLVGFIIFSVVMGRLIESNRIFYVFALFIFIAVWAISILVSKLYVEFTTTNAQIASFMVNFPAIDFIMPRMIFYAIIYSIAVSITLYTKDN